ncbi:MAG: hypothetical protein AB8B94_12235 [Hyphomicrobiales bacterium]
MSLGFQVSKANQRGGSQVFSGAVITANCGQIKHFIQVGPNMGLVSTRWMCKADHEGVFALE